MRPRRVWTEVAIEETSDPTPDVLHRPFDEPVGQRAYPDHESDEPSGKDVTAHRARAPWYLTKTQPSVAEMLAKLRRVLIATRFRLPRPEQPTPAEIHAIRLAWETHAA